MVRNQSPIGNGPAEVRGRTTRTTILPQVTNLKARLAAGERILIDGGTGSEVERQGAEMLTGAWSGASALTYPDIVRSVHEQFIDAGAEVIFANTYASSRHVLAQVGREHQFDEINRAGVRLALEARQNANAPHVIISGSMSTTEQGGEFPPHDVATQNYKDQLAIQLDEGIEMVTLEMMRNLDTTRAILEATADAGVPVWVGMSCVLTDEGPRLVYEGSLEEAIHVLDDYDIELLAIMHTETSDIDACLDIVDQHWDGPVGVYAQVGDWNGTNWFYDDTVTPEAHAALNAGWVARGVQVIGGCCGISPAHIRAMQGLL